MNIVYRDPQNYENEKQRSEKFWSENMTDEKIRERCAKHNEYFDNNKKKLSKYWSKTHNILLDEIFSIDETFKNVEIPEKEQSKPLFNVISELHQKAVNHAKEIYLILKTDPIYGGIFLWRILYEIQIRTGFFANEVNVHKSFDQAQKYAEFFLIHSELRSRKRILECTTITKKEKKELKDIARRLDELNKNNKEQKLARFDSDYGWTGFQSFKDLENLNISNQENLFHGVGFEQEHNRFKQNLSQLKKMFYLANDIGHSNSIIGNHLFTLLDQNPVNFMVYSQPLARYCLIIFTSTTLAMISSNCLYSLLGNKVDMGYNNFLLKTLNRIEQESWNAALQQAQDRTSPESE